MTTLYHAFHAQAYQLGPTAHLVTAAERAHTIPPLPRALCGRRYPLRVGDRALDTLAEARRVNNLCRLCDAAAVKLLP